MPNPLYSMFAGRSENPMQTSPLGNLIQQFNQFKSNFSGDPKAKVQELLSSGQMTQEQFNQLAPIAQQLQNTLFK